MTCPKTVLVGIWCASFALSFACSSSNNDGDGKVPISPGAGAGASTGASAGASGAGTGAGGTTSSTRSAGGAAGSATAKGGSSGAASSSKGGSAGASSQNGQGATTNADACPGLPFEAADAGAEGGAVCAGVSLEAERLDVDMYVMMDRSVSMAEEVGNTGKIRWDFVREAVQSFVEAKDAANIGIGIQFFGQSGSRDDDLDCNVATYATPAVDIGPAAKVGPDLVAAISNMVPGGLTPTYPALEGAVTHAKQWSRAHPGRATVVVLVTDGYPTQCQDPVSVSAIASVAKQAAEEQPPVRTYVVGLAAVDNLDTIARAGGTRAAYPVTDNADFARSFVTTLLNISSDPLACEYEIPAPNDGDLTVDLNKVQMVYTPAVGAAEEIPHANSYSECNNPAGGWYYDDPTTPTKILACPCTCARLAAGKVEIRLGCYPRRPPLR